MPKKLSFARKQSEPLILRTSLARGESEAASKSLWLATLFQLECACTAICLLGIGMTIDQSSGVLQSQAVTYRCIIAEFKKVSEILIKEMKAIDVEKPVIGVELLTFALPHEPLVKLFNIPGRCTVFSGTIDCLIPDGR